MAIKSDALHQYAQLRNSILKEKVEIEARLVQINKTLAGAPEAIMRAPAAPSRKRAKNKMSLKEAATQVISRKALTKPEILEAIKKTGYKFATKNPMNSINVLLYTGKTFKKADGGKFILAK